MTRVVAGFRATSITSPGLKGLGTFFRAGRAGLLTDLIFKSPGRVNSHTARFLRCLSITIPNSSSTALTSFLLSEVFSEIVERISVFVNFFCTAGALCGLDAAVFLFNFFFAGVFLAAIPFLFFFD